MKNTNRNWLKLTIYLVLSVGFVSAMAMTITTRKQKTNDEKGQLAVADNKTSIKDKKTEADKKREEESKAAFLEAYRVFMHPRCINCPPSGDRPFQGDDSH